MDYAGTFFPVAKIGFVRVIMSLAVNLQWPLYQLVEECLLSWSP